MYSNAQSLICNLSEFKTIIAKKKPKIMCFSETRQTKDDADKFLFIENYNIVRCDATNRHTGGVIIYISKNISFKVILNYSKSSTWFLAMEVYKGFKKGIYGIIYKSPQENINDFINLLEEFHDRIGTSNKFQLVCGDYNIDVKKVDNNTKKLIETCNQYNLVQLITDFTRETNKSATTIDLVFTNENEVKYETDNYNIVTDHKIIYIGIPNISNQDQHKQNFKEICSWKNYSVDRLTSALFDIDWVQLDYLDTIDEKSAFIFENLDKSVENLISKKYINCEINQPWYNGELRQLQGAVFNAKREFDSNSNEENWNEYKLKRNLYKYSLRKTENDYVLGKIEENKNNSKELWKILKSLYENNRENVQEVEFENTTSKDQKEIAENFNSFFVDSINSIQANIEIVNKNMIDLISQRESKFNFEPVNISQLKKIVDSMKHKNYIDNVNGRVLNDAMKNPFFASKFCILINDSFLEGKFPDNWKTSTIIPIPKITKPIKAKDYRPINMLPIAEKVIETIAKDQIQTYATEHEIIVEEQSGYRNGHSPETLLNWVADEWKIEIQNGKIVLVVSIDLSRAFDTVDRKLLIEKLRRYGFGDSAINWISDYLKNRKQKVKIGKFTSCQLNCDIGVVQGSCLGPLLFVLYVNDVPNILQHTKLKQFADDKFLTIACDTEEEALTKMNDDLSRLYEWLCCNKLSLNYEKTKYMTISLKRNLSNDSNIIEINHNIIERVNKMKYLGVIFDNKLSFNPMIDNIVDKMSKKYFLVKRISAKLNYHTIDLLYKTLLLPHINYCSSILFTVSDSQIYRVQKIQNKYLRMLLRVPWDTSTALMHNTANWLSVKQRIIYNTMTFIFKIENENSPQYLKCRLVPRGASSSYSLRNENSYQLPPFTKKVCKDSLFYNGVKLYNTIKNKIPTQTMTLSNFKKQCINYVKEHFKLT